MKKQFIVGLLVLCMASVAAVPVTQAFGLGDILKVGGISILIDKFAGQLNGFINTLTFKHGVGSDFATKVVPILSFGSGGYIGAAQVIGTQDLIDRTQAVVQIEGEFSGNTFRIKALIPIDSKNPVNFSRVNGVGVSAIIDVKI
jgi:opacity protein-like surface antigen